MKHKVHRVIKGSEEEEKEKKGEGEEEGIDVQNVAAEFCGGAHTSGFPSCGFIKAHPELQSHKSVYSRGSPTCGHCSCAEPFSSYKHRRTKEKVGEKP